MRITGQPGRLSRMYGETGTAGRRGFTLRVFTSNLTLIVFVAAVSLPVVPAALLSTIPVVSADAPSPAGLSQPASTTPSQPRQTPYQMTASLPPTMRRAPMARRFSPPTGAAERKLFVMHLCFFAAEPTQGRGGSFYIFIIIALPHASQIGKYGTFFSSENSLNAAFIPL